MDPEPSEKGGGGENMKYKPPTIHFLQVGGEGHGPHAPPPRSATGLPGLKTITWVVFINLRSL